ncbi:hypothetical protein Bca4012_026134 [Brassica carinata]
MHHLTGQPNIVEFKRAYEGFELKPENFLLLNEDENLLSKPLTLISPISTSQEIFAKRKLDESVFLGNRLQISYAPEFESLSDTKDKLETRRKEVLSRSNPQKAKSSVSQVTKPALTQMDSFSPQSPESQE